MCNSNSNIRVLYNSQAQRQWTCAAALHTMNVLNTYTARPPLTVNRTVNCTVYYYCTACCTAGRKHGWNRIVLYDSYQEWFLYDALPHIALLLAIMAMAHRYMPPMPNPLPWPCNLLCCCCCCCCCRRRRCARKQQQQGQQQQGKKTMVKYASSAWCDGSLRRRCCSSSYVAVLCTT